MVTFVDMPTSNNTKLSNLRSLNFFFIEIYSDFTVFYHFFIFFRSIQYEGVKHKIVIVTLLIQTVSIEMS